MTPVRSVARALLAAIFVTEGWAALREPERLVKPAKPMTDRISGLDPRLPSDPEALIRINGAVQVAGGVLLATGWATTPAALALAGSLVPTTLAGHPFWQHDDPAERRQQRVNFLKNAGLIGGLIFAALDNEGRPSLRWRAGHGAHHVRRRAEHEAHHVRARAAREAHYLRHRAEHEAHHASAAARRAMRKAKNLSSR
jgi:putative oxidoreductase